MRRTALAALGAIALAALLIAASTARPTAQAPAPLRVSVTVPAAKAPQPLDGRLLVILSAKGGDEPRFQVAEGPSGQPIFGRDVDGWRADAPAVIDDTAVGFPL